MNLNLYTPSISLLREKIDFFVAMKLLLSYSRLARFVYCIKSAKGSMYISYIFHGDQNYAAFLLYSIFVTKGLSIGKQFLLSSFSLTSRVYILETLLHTSLIIPSIVHLKKYEKSKEVQ